MQVHADDWPTLIILSTAHYNPLDCQDVRRTYLLHQDRNCDTSTLCLNDTSLRDLHLTEYMISNAPHFAPWGGTKISARWPELQTGTNISSFTFLWKKNLGNSSLWGYYSCCYFWCPLARISLLYCVSQFATLRVKTEFLICGGGK